MYPRTNYEMTQEDCDALLAACKPTPVMCGGQSMGGSPQGNANRAWQALGEKMGFDYMTAAPIAGKGMKFFSAVPSENETQREERLAKEREADRQKEIATITERIERDRARLAELT